VSGSLSPRIAMPALAIAAAIVGDPFAGLVALVGLAQLGGLIRAAVPTTTAISPWRGWRRS
jgi:hypothetical protein